MNKIFIQGFCLLVATICIIADKYHRETYLLPFETNENYFTQMNLLISEILRITKVNHCYSIITDRIHELIFMGNFFKSSNIWRTYFFIKILESEDMISPNYHTIRILNEIKKNDCDLIFILILNGIQMMRFLKFIDLNRVLNTNVKYVLLYDYRILSSDLFYIWKKILTVIFIRNIHANSDENKERNIWFEIITVPYPDVLETTFYGKRINIWSKNRFIMQNKLFPDKTSDLKGSTIRIIVYEHVPTVMRNLLNNETFGGLEVQIAKSLGKVMNFIPDFYESPDYLTEKWGRLLLNGSYTGLISEIVNGHADLALGGLYFIPYHLTFMDLSVPHSSECLTFLTPESSTDNSWKTLILPFNADMWAGVLVSLFCVGTIFYMMSRWNNSIIYGPHQRQIYKKSNLKENLKFTIFKHSNMEKYKEEKLAEYEEFKLKYKKKQIKPRPKDDIFDSYTNCILLTYSMLLQVSLPRMPFKWPIRLLTGWYWVYCILVVVAYRASFTAILTNPSPRITIDTLEELANSPIVAGAWGEQNKEFFSSAFDDAAQKVGAKMEQVDNINNVLERIASGKYAYYDNEYYLRYLRLSRNPSEGEEVLHIMSECVVKMPISIGLEKNSPLKPNIDKYLRRLVEGGLIQKWLTESTANLTSEEQQPEEAKMNLKKFSGSFVGLVAGYFFSWIACIAEKLHFKYIVQKHPLYDKYNPRLYYEYIKSH